MSLALIWAQAHRGVIGRDGALPWHLPEDLAHFRALTHGATVLMGRRTWDSLPDRFRPLPGRRNVVLTRDCTWSAAGAQTRSQLDAALDELLAGDTPVWVIGGAQVYAAALPRADRLEVTELDLAVDGDVLAPVVTSGWTTAGRDPASGWHLSAGGVRYRFLSYVRPGEGARGRRIGSTLPA